MKTNTISEKCGLSNDSESVICTRRDELWVFVYDYLEMLEYTPIKIDKEFMMLYTKLIGYVYSKIKIPDCGGEVIDSCHLVWQNISDEKR